MKQTEILTRVSHVNSWEPAVYSPLDRYSPLDQPLVVRNQSRDVMAKSLGYNQLTTHDNSHQCSVYGLFRMLVRDGGGGGGGVASL